MIFEGYRDETLYKAERDCVCIPHLHRSVEILYVISGDKEVLIDGEKRQLSAGEAAVCMPYAVHEYFPSDGVQFCFTLLPEHCTEFFTATEELTLKDCVLPKGEITEDIYAHAKKLSEQSNSFIQRGIANYILGLITQFGEFVPRKRKGNDLTRRILEYVETHYAEETTLESAAAHFGYSKYYFSKLFNSRFSENFSAYVNRVRIYKSLTLLKKQKISAVYSECGFHSPQQFYLNFKKYTRLTPKEYLAKTNCPSYK